MTPTKQIIPIVITLLVLFSCSRNPYASITKTNPKNGIDSFNLAGVCKRIFPFDTSSAHETITFIPATDSTEFYKKMMDSIQAKFLESTVVFENVYRDTCTSAKYLFSTGFSQGFDKGYFKGKLDCTHNTLLKVDSFYVSDTRAQNIMITNFNRLQREKEKVEKGSMLKMMLAGIFIILFSLSAVLNYLQARRIL